MKNEQPASQKSSGKIDISIQGRWNVIHISKGLIRALGMPTHVCLRVNEGSTSVAVCPCDASEVLSFKTPEGLFCGKPVKFRIASQEFVRGLLQANELDSEKTYTLHGVYSEQLKAVVCSFDNGKTEG